MPCLATRLVTARSVNSTDYLDVRAKVGNTTASSNYTPYYDVLGTGAINSTSYLDVKSRVSQSQTAVVERSWPAGFGRGRPDDDRRRCRSERRDVGGAGRLDRPDRRRGGTGGQQPDVGRHDVDVQRQQRFRQLGSSSSSSRPAAWPRTPDATDAAVSDFDLADLYV